MRVVKYICAKCHTDYGSSRKAEKEASKCEKRQAPAHSWAVGTKFVDQYSRQIVILETGYRLYRHGAPPYHKYHAAAYRLQIGPKTKPNWVGEEFINLKLEEKHWRLAD